MTELNELTNERMVVLVKFMVFSVVTPCSVKVGYQRGTLPPQYLG